MDSLSKCKETTGPTWCSAAGERDACKITVTTKMVSGKLKVKDGSQAKGKLAVGLLKNTLRIKIRTGTGIL